AAPTAPGSGRSTWPSCGRTTTASAASWRCSTAWRAGPSSTAERPENLAGAPRPLVASCHERRPAIPRACPHAGRPPQGPPAPAPADLARLLADPAGLRAVAALDRPEQLPRRARREHPGLVGRAPAARSAGGHPGGPSGNSPAHVPEPVALPALPAAGHP